MRAINPAYVRCNIDNQEMIAGLVPATALPSTAVAPDIKPNTVAATIIAPSWQLIRAPAGAVIDRMPHGHRHG